MTNEDKVAVKRFEPCIRMEHFGDMQDYADMREFVSGGYVLYFDYDKLEKALAEKDAIISGLNRELEIAWDKRKNYASEADDIKAQLSEKDKRIEEAEKQAEHWKSHYYNDDDKGRKIAELEQKLAELQYLSSTSKEAIQKECKRLEKEIEIYKYIFSKNTDFDKVSDNRLEQGLMWMRKCKELEAQCSKMRVALEKMKKDYAFLNKQIKSGTKIIELIFPDYAKQALSDGGVK